jgi:signal peptidase I
MSVNLFKDILRSGHDLKFKVTGRSMRPFINCGDVVTLRNVKPETLRYGQVIFYTDSHGTAVLHRVIARTEQTDGTIMFTTKGDGLGQADSPVQSKRVLGKAVKVKRKLYLVGSVNYCPDSTFLVFLYRSYSLLVRLKRQLGSFVKHAVKYRCTKKGSRSSLLP